MLMNETGAVQFVMDAFGHLKAIGASKAAKALLEKAGVTPDEGVTGLGKDFIEAARLRFWDRARAKSLGCVEPSNPMPRP